MTRHLTFDEFTAIRRCLHRGWRYVRIARAFNVSMWTIARIDTEYRYQLDPIDEAELPVDDAPPDYVPDNLRRCPSCGAMIYVWPCLACRMAVQVNGARS